MSINTEQIVPGETRVRYNHPMLVDLGYVGVATAVDPEQSDLMRVRCDNGFELWTSASYWTTEPPGRHS